MTSDDFVKTRVSTFYWKDNFNCATTTLRILAEAFKIKLHKQVIDAATGMHGAGAYGAQCGLVEGTLMFLGIFLRKKNTAEKVIAESCREFASQFEKRFISLQCSILRPQGFHPDNPSHICEEITCKAVEFSLDFITALTRPPQRKNKRHETPRETTVTPPVTTHPPVEKTAKKLRWISRVDNQQTCTYAWKVCVKRKGKLLHKYFSDNTYGSKETALEAAIAYRDALIFDVTNVDYHIWRRTWKRPSNTSGIVGVARYVTKPDYPYWQAFWRDADGKRQTRTFSVSIFGEHRAKELACETRKEGIEEVERTLKGRLVKGSSQLLTI